MIFIIGVIFYLHFFLDVALVLRREGDSLDGLGQDGRQKSLESIIFIILYDFNDDVAPALLDLWRMGETGVVYYEVQYFARNEGELGGHDLVDAFEGKLNDLSRKGVRG